MANEIENNNVNPAGEGQEAKPKKKAVAILNLQYSRTRRNDASKNKTEGNRGGQAKTGQQRGFFKNDRNTDKNGTKTGDRQGGRNNDRSNRRDNNADSYRPSGLIRPRADHSAVRPSSLKNAETVISAPEVDKTPVAPKVVEAPKAEVVKPVEAPKAEAPKAEAVKPVETPKAEAPKAEAVKPVETPKAEAPKAEAVKPVEAPKAEAPKAEAVKPAEAPKAEAAKPVEVPKVAVVPKAEAPKAEAAKPVEAPKAEAAKPVEAPKAEAVKPVEAPKAEAAKPVEAPKAAEAPKAEAPRENVYRISGNILEEMKAQEEREQAARANRERQNREKRENKDNKNRSQGDRPNRGNNNQGDRPNRGNNNQGDRPNRGNNNQGDRPNRGNNNQGDRPNRGSNQGDRQERGNFHSQENRNGDARRDNRQGGFNNDRNNNDRRGSFHGNDKDKDERQNDRFSGNRGAAGGNRFNKDAAPAADEVRGKESRERGAAGRRNDNGKRTQDHDKLGKRQENYINLEKHGGKKKTPAPQVQKEDPDEIKTLTLPEKMTIHELADAMKLQPSAIIKNLFMKGKMVTMNSEILYEDAEELAMEFNFVCEPEEKVDVIAELLKEDEEDEDEMITRPPVVCVMGHVDHGKTSLLDAIRSTRVTDREAGGITQHIGASVVSINGQKITFLDTPGHEAFTAMRMRGANSTDIAILVVAADDGVMPQTIEAINHAKAAGVEIIVAVNKIDKPGANVERVKQEMTEYGLVAEDWGGSTIFCPVSAKTHEGIDDLLEMVLLTADVLELKANPKRNARGLVIEAQLDKGRGAVATVLVQKGTLHVGDCVACGSSYGKVRAMIDDKGRRVKEAAPSTPVEILGLNNVPSAGETFVVCDNEKEAKSFAETYIAEEKNRLLEETKARMSLDDLFSQIQSGNVKELNLIVKADVQGSVEAVKTSLMKLSNEEVVVKVIHGAVGAINESDVILASASNAIIIGFNVRPDAQAKATAEHENVEIRLYNVIYTAIEEIERKMKGMKDPVYEEKIIGHAEIRAIFKASGVGNIAGSYVMDGVIERGCKIRITREGKQIYEGNLASLKRFKDDVKEVKTNYECGLVFEGFGEFQELDMVEAYKMVEVPQ